MQTNADRSKKYVVLEREHVAIKKEIQKHPHQRRQHHEGVRRRREEDPEAPARAKQRPLPLSTSDETRLLRLTLSRPAAEEQSFFLESAPRAQKTTRRALQPLAQTEVATARGGRVRWTWSTRPTSRGTCPRRRSVASLAPEDNGG